MWEQQASLSSSELPITALGWQSAREGTMAETAPRRGETGAPENTWFQTNNLRTQQPALLTHRDHDSKLVAVHCLRW